MSSFQTFAVEIILSFGGGLQETSFNHIDEGLAEHSTHDEKNDGVGDGGEHRKELGGVLGDSDGQIGVVPPPVAVVVGPQEVHYLEHILHGPQGNPEETAETQSQSHHKVASLLVFHVQQSSKYLDVHDGRANCWNQEKHDASSDHRIETGKVIRQEAVGTVQKRPMVVVVMSVNDLEKGESDYYEGHDSVDDDASVFPQVFVTEVGTTKDEVAFGSQHKYTESSDVFIHAVVQNQRHAEDPEEVGPVNSVSVISKHAKFVND